MSDLPHTVDDLVSPPGTVHRGRNPSIVHRVLAQQVQLPVRGSRRGWAPDVVLATTPVIPVLPSGPPVVAMVHDLRFLSFPGEFPPVTRIYRKFAYRYGLRRSDGLLANSEFTRDEILHVAPRRRATPEVVYLGADHVDHWPASQAAQGHGIAFAHWSNKQPDVAVRSWALLRDRQTSRGLQPFSARLHVVGVRADDASRLRDLARQLEVEDLVEIHPFLEDAEYRSLFASASVVLLASTTEGFGLPIAEAQRLGIPVVANGVGAVVEVGGDAALYSTDGSPGSFAALCEQALFDPVRREELIVRGRDNARRFTWVATAERTRRELERCVTRRPGRRRPVEA